MQSDELWKLENGFRLKVNENPKSFKEQFMEINLDANKIEKNFRPPETISFWSINEYIKNLESSGFSVKKHEVYKNYLYSYPLILISMVLLGCILSIKKDRIKKNVLKIIWNNNWSYFSFSLRHYKNIWANWFSQHFFICLVNSNNF